MGVYIGVEQLSDHSLILRLVLGCMRFEKVDASLAQGYRYLHTLIPECKLMGRGKKIGNNPILTNRFIRVFYFRAHRSFFPYARSQPREFG